MILANNILYFIIYDSKRRGKAAESLVLHNTEEYYTANLNFLDLIFLKIVLNMNSCVLLTSEDFVSYLSRLDYYHPITFRAIPH